MEHKYPHLISPVKAGGVVLRNRMISSCNLPHFLQGPENFPSDSILTFVEGIAKAGAAVVTIPDRFNNTRQAPMEDICRGPCWDLSDPSVHNYMSQMCESAHFWGAAITVQISKLSSVPRDVDVCERVRKPGPSMMTELDEAREGAQPIAVPFKEISREQMNALRDEIVQRCALYQSFGFDGVCLHMAYCYNAFANFLPKEVNLRTDEYGGSVENRARFPLEVCTEIKKACGRDFIIEMQISGDCMPEDELIRFGKLCEGLVDVFQIRMMDMDGAHITPYNYDGVSVPSAAHYAEVLKKAGVKVLVAPCGGFHDPAMNERLIAEGKTDLVAMARPFISDPWYVTKIVEERAEDIVPCLHCNRCHAHPSGTYLTTCAVNPDIGISHRVGKVEPVSPELAQRIAIVGGGPAGMRAALFASRRGHIVTLYEKEMVLGGQLTHADYPSFKWAIKRYKDFLIKKVEQDPAITVMMGTEVTPEMLTAAEYDAVIAAVGARPKFPEIEGLTDTRVWAPIEVYGRENELGKRIVVVGGGETGTETAMYLAELGHDVTILTRQDVLAPEAWCVHLYALLKRRYDAYPNLKKVFRATTSRIETGRVTYLDRDNNRNVIECDDVVVAGGAEACSDLAMSFAGTARRLIIIGDARKPGNIRSCNRTALAAIMQL